MNPATLKAPFPYFGGKRRAAEIVWPRLGDVTNYIEPFAGSIAMLLCRPHLARIEAINDVDCYVANFWRATQHDPDAVALHADGPVNEADLHARHRWLVLSTSSAEFRQRMKTDPDYFDARVAGWWCMRIAVCGYDTDGYACLEREGWSVVAWKSPGGYGNRSAAGSRNCGRERIWFSPACLDPEDGRYPLFANELA